MSEIVDSGNRREFETGAVRDIGEGKGRCDLLPLQTIAAWQNDDLLKNIGEFVVSGDRTSLYYAIDRFSKAAFGDYQTAILELAIHYEDGCRKYGERNWEKGIPLHCFIDSAVRHYLKYLRGDKDERHDRAFLWNLFGALWTMENHPELNDLPCREMVLLHLFDKM